LVDDLTRSEKSRDTRYFLAAEDAGRLADNVAAVVERSVGVDWYAEGGTDVDRAAFMLCRLRRARGGEKGGPRFGDEAVRQVLTAADPAALVWLLSRAVSYMDESGFPEAVELWFPEETESLA
jgi:hypothetical protein